MYSLVDSDHSVYMFYSWLYHFSHSYLSSSFSPHQILFPSFIIHVKCNLLLSFVFFFLDLVLIFSYHCKGRINNNQSLYIHINYISNNLLWFLSFSLCLCIYLLLNYLYLHPQKICQMKTIISWHRMSKWFIILNCYFLRWEQSKEKNKKWI